MRLIKRVFYFLSRLRDDEVIIRYLSKNGVEKLEGVYYDIFKLTPKDYNLVNNEVDIKISSMFKYRFKYLKRIWNESLSISS